MTHPMERLIANIEATGNHNDRLTPGELYAAYTLFAKADENRSMTSASFRRQVTKKLVAKGAQPRKSASTCFTGVRIKNNEGSEQ